MCAYSITYFYYLTLCGIQVKYSTVVYEYVDGRSTSTKYFRCFIFLGESLGRLQTLSSSRQNVQQRKKLKSSSLFPLYYPLSGRTSEPEEDVGCRDLTASHSGNMTTWSLQRVPDGHCKNLGQRNQSHQQRCPSRQQIMGCLSEGRENPEAPGTRMLLLTQTTPS